MRVVTVALALLVAVLQYRLWLAEGGIAETVRLADQIAAEQARNAELAERNAALERQVIALQSGTEAIEQRARESMGLVREGEVYFQFPGDERGDSAK